MILIWHVMGRDHPPEWADLGLGRVEQLRRRRGAEWVVEGEAASQHVPAEDAALAVFEGFGDVDVVIFVGGVSSVPWGVVFFLWLGEGSLEVGFAAAWEQGHCIWWLKRSLMGTCNLSLPRRRMIVTYWARRKEGAGMRWKVRSNVGTEL